MIRSYSKKACPWDNACIESFHALFKREWLNRVRIFNYRHAYKLVFQYIEIFYILSKYTVIVDACLQMNIKRNIEMSWHIWQNKLYKMASVIERSSLLTSTFS